MDRQGSQVLVGRRYLDRGFVDVAMRLFVRNAGVVEPGDWQRLVERLLEQKRIAEVVQVCELGRIPLPRARLLALGDDHLRRRDIDGAMRFYELAGAAADRWARLLDVLTGLPDRERLALVVATRHLEATQAPQPPLAAAS